jgi:hypothetical protein
MPLIPVAQAAVAEHSLKSVRFLMKDGCKRVPVLVSNPALVDIELPAADARGYFDAFKQYRKCFERIASQKYDRGQIETDGSVCIRSLDVPLASAD